jgi:bromodomain adjacent to zinc finger domain protein 1A
MGRLDHLVEAVYERYKDRYFRDESVFSTHHEQS